MLWQELMKSKRSISNRLWMGEHLELFTLPRPRKFVDCFRRIEELSFQPRKLQTSSNKLFVFVWRTPLQKAETGARFTFCSYSRLVLRIQNASDWLSTLRRITETHSKVALDKRPHFFVVHQDRVFANPGEPPLKHDFDQPVILLVGGCRGLS